MFQFASKNLIHNTNCKIICLILTFVILDFTNNFSNYRFFNILNVKLQKCGTFNYLA